MRGIWVLRDVAGLRRVFIYCVLLILVGCGPQPPAGSSLAGGKLEICSTRPMTGYYRDGFCRSAEDDEGQHLLCAELSLDFLKFSMEAGNDLMTARADFPGLQPGDRWCLCVSRWYDAFRAGVAPPLDLQSSHVDALEGLPAGVIEASERLPDYPEM